MELHVHNSASVSYSFQAFHYFNTESKFVYVTACLNSKTVFDLQCKHLGKYKEFQSHLSNNTVLSITSLYRELLCKQILITLSVKYALLKMRQKPMVL